MVSLLKTKSVKNTGDTGKLDLGPANTCSGTDCEVTAGTVWWLWWWPDRDTGTWFRCKSDSSKAVPSFEEVGKMEKGSATGEFSVIEEKEDQFEKWHGHAEIVDERRAREKICGYGGMVWLVQVII
jgi:hypothetical protein